MPRQRRPAPPAELAKLPTFKKAAALVAAYRKGKTGKTAHAPESVQRAVAALLVEARTAEVTQTTALGGLELSSGNVLRWAPVRAALGMGAKAAPKGRAFRPVRIAKAGARRNGAGPGLVVTTPQGYQIEGTVAEVAALLKTLGG